MCFELNACTQTLAKILITRIPKGIKEDISAQIKSVKTREKLKKKKETGFSVKTGAICPPDTTKPKLENNFARFIYHSFDLLDF